MGVTWGRAAQLHPNPIPTSQPFLLPTTSIPRANCPQSQLPVLDTHPPLGSSMFRPGRAAPCALPPLREASRIPSSGIPRHGGCAQCPQGGCSARGDNDRRCHLLVPRGNSLHGNVPLCHRVAPPGASMGGREAAVAFQGFSLGSTEALENSFLRFGTYFLLLLQQQTAAIPMASSTRSPVGWTLGVRRSISQPMADELHQNSSIRSQNHSRHHHKIPSHPWREAIGNSSCQEEIWVLNPSPTQWHSCQPWKAPTAPKRNFKLKKN